MKVFLANPPCRIPIGKGEEKFFVRAGSRWPFSVTKKFSEKPEYIPFPFYLAYTAAILESKKHQVIVDDGVATNETENNFLEKVLNDHPQIILFETSTPTIDYDLNLIKKIKKNNRDIIVCLAGTHITTFAGEVLKENEQVNFAFLSEYELSFAQLVESLSEHRHNKISDIAGLAFRKNDRIVIKKPELIDPLDELPFPARHLFPNNANPDPTIYWDGFCQYKPAIQMHASRGCPFRCNFCLWNQVMYRNSKYRFFSAKRVVDEMEEVIRKYQAKEIYFDDDTFTANKKQVLSICKEIKRRELRVNWSVMGDAMVTDKEMVEVMADAGCIGIKFGVESGNREILKHIEKPINFEKLKEFTNWCAKKKIKTHATFTFGLSGETKKTMRETLDLAKNLDVDSVQFSLTIPFPGTRYYDEVKNKGLLINRNWEDFDGSSDSVIRFEGLDKKEVIDFYQKASGQWLSYKIKKPKWLWRQVYNLVRMSRGQGLGAVFKRFKRGMELIFGI